MSPGQLIQSRYRIEELLAEGQVSETYSAFDLAEQKIVVIKAFAFKHAEAEKEIELFEREARVLEQLDHPDIPSFCDFFQIESKQDVRLYLVQEFIPGKTLARWVEEGRRFSEQECVRLALSIGKILTYLHSFSPPFIHRDIKPTNIILDADGQVHLIDFGAVRDKILQDRLASGGGSTIIGTYGYMPYEQFAGKALPATDLYSLGATIIYVLSRKDPAAMEKDRMRIDFASHIEVSTGFDAVLHRLLDPDWKQRYQSSDELMEALHALRQPSKPRASRLQLMVLLCLSSIIVWLLASWSGNNKELELGNNKELELEEESLTERSLVPTEQEKELRIKYRCARVQNPIHYPGVNLLLNPGLENPCNWRFEPRFEAHHLLSQDVFSGRRGFALKTNDRVSQRIVLTNEFISLLRKSEYTLTVSGYMKTESPQQSNVGPIRVLVKVIPQFYEKPVELGGFPAADTTDWKEYSKTWDLEGVRSEGVYPYEGSYFEGVFAYIWVELSGAEPPVKNTIYYDELSMVIRLKTKD